MESEARSDLEFIKQRKDNFYKFIKNSGNWIFYAILGIIVWINLYIRTLPMRINPSSGKPGLWDLTRDSWTLGPDLDPFLFLRYAKDIMANGQLMAIDSLRYVPLGYETARETQLLPYMIAWLHKIINWFGEYSGDYAGVIFPVVISVFSAIFFFLLVKKIFDSKTKNVKNIIAIVATLLMVTLPSLLGRTIAGIPEKESVGFMLIFASLYFFLSSWRSKKLRSVILYGIAGGLFTAMLGLIWGGITFVYATIALFGLIDFILEKFSKKEFIGYSSWLFSSMIFWLPFTEKLGFGFFEKIKNFSIGTTTGASLIVWILMAFYFIIFTYKNKIRFLEFLENPKIKRIPKPLIVLIAFILIGIILSVFPPVFNQITNEISSGYNTIINPSPDRLISTVAENKLPDFNDWKGSMGPIFNNIPIFFWMFFFGVVLLFYETIKFLRRKEKIILVSSLILFLLALVFYKNISFGLFFHVIGYLLILGAGCYVYYQRYKEREIGVFKRINSGYLILLLWTIIAIISTRHGVRFMMVLTPVAAISVAYIVIGINEKAIKSEKGSGSKIPYWVLAIILILLLITVVRFQYQVSVSTARNHVPSAYTHQWQRAMGWVRENTPENAVFGHWWDYGYWLQSIGERATMLDGGNVIGYWNYLMGRHVLTGESEQEALNVLYNHDVTHFLIDSTDIGKYSAYSLIGSDSEYDRFSWIGNYLLDDKQIQETKDQMIYIYSGGIAFDEDIVIRENGNQVLLPREAAATGALLVYKDKNNGTYTKAESIVVYNGKQYKIPLRYLYFDKELIDFGNEEENTIEACVYIFPRIDNVVNPIGAAMYLSPRNMRALWVKLYLLNQGENFRLVHSEPSAVHYQILDPQGIETNEIVYYQGIQGPIKIWEVRYTGREKQTEEYVQTSFPEDISNRAFR
jgi:asparagine N-glycosylation enzyme membrane subunit Stt3